jgi:HEAT repeat protein
VPVLLKLVRDPDNFTDTRHAAAEALGRLRDRATLKAVEELAADYPEVSVRRRLR